MDAARGNSGDRRSYVIVGRLIAVMFLGANLAACTVAASPSLPAGASDSPAASILPSETDSFAPSPTATTATATASQSISPSPKPTPTAKTGSLPTGDWTAINWTSVPSGHAPTGLSKDSDSEFDLFGWSGGFIDFVHKQGTTNIVPWYSADGLTWHAAKALDSTGLKTDFGPDYVARISSFAEGPAGIVATGYLQPLGIACGPSEYPVQAIWNSVDGGATWSRMSVTAAFPKGSIYRISGGSAGYIARGTLGDKVAMWVSGDARTWKQADLSASTFAKTYLTTGVAFSGGYVLAGTTAAGTGGCGGSDESVKFTGALWHSSDGKSWTRDTLPGAPVGDWAWMDVQRLSDHVLYATETAETDNGPDVVATDTYAAWTSKDGKTWTKVAAGPPLTDSNVYSNGQYGVVVSWPYGDETAHVSVWAFSAALHPVQLTQRGDAPLQQPWLAGAMGPTGFLAVTADGTHFWLGVPQTH